MKTLQAGGGKTGRLLLLALLLFICRSGRAQGDFQNLDFENPILPLTPDGNMLTTANAIPGWSAIPLLGDTHGNMLIFYNAVSLGGAMVALDDNNNTSPKPIQGNYSVYLFGASSYAPPAEQHSASIGQTATIPITAESLTFLAGDLFGTLQVTFNGLPINYVVTGSSANYNVYAADISAYAGQYGQLLFTAPVNTRGILDNIQFSSSPVPEPGVSALTALGTVLLGCRRRWKRL